MFFLPPDLYLTSRILRPASKKPTIRTLLETFLTIQMSIRYIQLQGLLLPFFMTMLLSGTLQQALGQDLKLLQQHSLEELITQSAALPPRQSGGALVMGAAPIGISLVLMALNHSAELPKDSSQKRHRDAICAHLRQLADSLFAMANEDPITYKQFLSARRLRVQSAGEQRKKDSLYRSALQEITRVPLQAADYMVRSLVLVQEGLPYCSWALLPDIGAGVYQLQASLRAVLLLARSNIQLMAPAHRIPFEKESHTLQEYGEYLSTVLLNRIENQLYEPNHR